MRRKPKDDLRRLSDGGLPPRYHFGRYFLVPTAKAETPSWSPKPVSLLGGFPIRVLPFNMLYSDGKGSTSLCFPMN